jgi:hypothetical protein
MTLARTGQWTWREGELSLKSFYSLSTEKKEEHILFLFTLNENELSSNDRCILNNNNTKIKPKKLNFFI